MSNTRQPAGLRLGKAMRAAVGSLAALAIGSAAAASPPAVLTNARIETASGRDLPAALGGVRAPARGAEPVWVGWSVPLVAGQGEVCCFENGHVRGCRLERGNHGMSINDRGGRADAGELLILVRFVGSRTDEVQAVGDNCLVDAGGRRLIWLEDVAPAASVAYLGGLAQERNADRGAVGQSLVALALHAGREADAVLADFAGPEHPSKLREEAIFWLGNSRGRFGYETVKRLAAIEDDADILEKVAFALSQSPVPEANGTLTQLAQENRIPEVRSQALFWLAQRGDPGAAETILRAIAEDRDADVREQAVFALSQLPDGSGVDALVRLCKTGRPEIRKQALFWLGQSEDPRAMDIFEDLLLRR